MGFKKHNWNNYGELSGNIQVELKILSEDNKRLDFFRWSTSDKNAENNILRIIKKKYGIMEGKKNKNNQIREEEDNLLGEIDW